MDADELRKVCLDAGADDVGFVSIDRGELDGQRGEILALYPWTKGLISIVCRMNREPIRSPARSVANLEFHHTGDRTNEVAHAIVAALEARGVRAVNPSMGFPMEMDRSPGKMWVVADKPVAVAAGLGQMGIHRNVIHPRFGDVSLQDQCIIRRTTRAAWITLERSAGVIVPRAMISSSVRQRALDQEELRRRRA